MNIGSGKNHPLYEKTRSNETKDKISKKLKGRKLSESEKTLRTDNMLRVWEERRKNGIVIKNRSKSISLMAIHNKDKTTLYFNSYKECSEHFKKCFATIKSVVKMGKTLNDYLIKEI